MHFCMNDMLYAFSYALDCVAKEMLGVSTYHAGRVAYISVLMGQELGCGKEALTDLAACAALHDCAISEYIKEEFQKGVNILEHKEDFDTSGHCIAGEKNIKQFPFVTNVEGAVLYHHENADGSGPFKKKEGETPLFAEVIHLADELDTKFDLSINSREKFIEIALFVRKNLKILFSAQCVSVFEKAITYERLKRIKEDNIQELLKELLPQYEREYSKEEVKKIGDVFALITDYKSSYTSSHSIELAKKAEKMAEFYQFDEEKKIKLYFAGAVHDLGKLVIHNDILEKPDKLTDGEFMQMKNHAYYTYKMLSQIKGLEDITRWAALHHEKLNGKGYPFGYKATQLGFEERLMACLDIYQALTEERSYKKGLLHKEAMKILTQMAEEGFIDKKIVGEINIVF